MIERAGEALVRAMLLVDEAPLAAAIEGTSGFTEHFEQSGERDSRGRSLRQFDLRRRLFKYPLSYMVYSRAFNGLPGEAKEFVYRRLAEVLGGVDRAEDFAHVSESDRVAILEILRDTKPDFSPSR